MNNSCTVSQGYITVAGNKIRFFMLFFTESCGTVKERLIFLIFQILSLIPLQYLGILAKHGIYQSTRHIVGVTVRSLDLNVFLRRIYAECHVRGQSPGRRRPGQEIGVLTYHLKPGNSRAFLDILIALGNLVRRKRGAAARAVGDNLKALVQKALVPDLL